MGTASQFHVWLETPYYKLLEKTICESMVNVEAVARKGRIVPTAMSSFPMNLDKVDEFKTHLLAML